jgi:transposase
VPVLHVPVSIQSVSNLKVDASFSFRNDGVDTKNSHQNGTMGFVRRCRGMARLLLTTNLRCEVAPLLLPPRARPQGGRSPIENPQALIGILFVPSSSLPWEMVPAEMGCGCCVDCWRRLRDWQAAGVWERLHAAGAKAGAGRAWTVLLSRRKEFCHRLEPNGTGKVEHEAQRPHRRPRPAARLANCGHQPARQRADAGRPHYRAATGQRPTRTAPSALGQIARRHDLRCQVLWQECRARGMVPRIARKGVKRSECPGRNCWVVERTYA